MREEEVSLVGIKLKIAGNDIQAAPIIVPEGRKLERESAGVYVLPRLGLHQMIVFERP